MPLFFKHMKNRCITSKSKHSEQIVAYEMKPQNFTIKQWTFERAFLLRAFKRGMFNKMIYTCPNGSGTHTAIRNKNDLSQRLVEIDRGFKENPQGYVRYAVGMNLEI